MPGPHFITVKSNICRINALPIIDLNLSFTTIKYKLKAYLWNRFLSNFDDNIKLFLHSVTIDKACIYFSGKDLHAEAEPSCQTY